MVIVSYNRISRQKKLPGYSIWSILDQEVQKAKPQNIAEIKMEIIKACNALPQEIVQKAIAQFPKRLQLFIDVGGNLFEYKM